MDKENILICLSGMSPAVITEAIYAFALKEEIMFSEIKVITTKEGAEQITTQLFNNKIIDNLKSDLSKPFSDFCFCNHSRFIKIISDVAENNDVQTTDDSVITANFITEEIRAITSNPDKRLFFSIAGGRKNMSGLGALAMSLLGRDDDVLFHILVNEPYENPKLNPKFYFPTEITHKLENKKISGNAAEITISKIPFVKISQLFHEKFKSLPGNYQHIVQQANDLVQSKVSRIKILVKNHSMNLVKNDSIKIDFYFNGKSIKLTDQKSAFLYALTLSKKSFMANENNSAVVNLENYFYTVKEKKLPSIITHQLDKIDGSNIPRIYSELKSIIKGGGFDVLISERGIYGLDYNKCEVIKDNKL